MDLPSLTLDERKALFENLVPDVHWDVFGTASKSTLQLLLEEKRFDFAKRATIEYLHSNHPLQAAKVTKIAQVRDLMTTPQLALYRGKPLGGSRISRNKAATNETATNKNPYWMRCLICGADAQSCGRVISEAHILEGVRTYAYDEYGTASGYADDLDPSSARNYIPLCGTEGQAGSCHDLFDTFKIALLYNPLKSVYFLYTPLGHYVEGYHGKVIRNIPHDFLPYKRLLAARAFATGFQCLDETMLNLPTLTMKLRESVQSSSEGFQQEDHSGVFNFSGQKRGIQSSEEEVEQTKRQKRAERFSKQSASSAAVGGATDSAGSWSKTLTLATKGDS
eukprot:gene25990-29357_t